MHKPLPVPTFDTVELERKTFLTSREAAWYLGYTPARYGTPTRAYNAFHKLITRAGVPRHYSGLRRLHFRRTDLIALSPRDRAHA